MFRASILIFESGGYGGWLGARQPFEAILVSSKARESDVSNPLIVVLHGGPHDVASTTFCKSLAFLSSIGFSLLVVNYRQVKVLTIKMHLYPIKF